MSNLLLVIIAAALVNNAALEHFFGLKAGGDASGQLKTAAGLGGAVIVLTTAASGVAALVYDFVLAPLGMTWLRTVLFLPLIVGLAALLDAALNRALPAVRKDVGPHLPLAAVSAVVLGVVLLNLDAGYHFLECVAAGFGASVGYALALVLFTGVRTRIDESAVPKAFRGAPILLLAASLMAIAFLGFSVLPTP